jgi:hypothetical protein
VGLADKILQQPEAAAILEPMLEPITFTHDLADMLDGEIPAPPILIDDLLYGDGQVHTLSGHPGCGKSTLAMWMAYDQLLQQRHVTWLDFESGTRQTARRMQAIGVTGAMARSCLNYAPFPGRIEAQVEDIARRWPGSLIVIDSMSKALAAAGASENANDEVTAWLSPVVRACKDHQIPIVIIDHISKGGGLSEYSRGAGAKHADEDVQWRINKVEEFNRKQAGLIHVENKKDREGFLGFDLYFKVGDGQGGLPLTPTTGPSEGGDDDGTKPAI